MGNNNILIIGGDLRLHYLYLDLSNKGYTVFSLGIPEIKDNILPNQISKCSTVILPIPYSKDKKTIHSITDINLNIDYFLTLLAPCSTIYGGCFTNEFIHKCNELNLVTKDFMDNNSFEIFNSISTAEGAIAEAISISPINIHKSSCLILGYGKCGTAIASRLKALNANTSVFARNNTQISLAYEQGHKSYNIAELSQKIEKYDFIFNTIPSMILTRNVLCNVSSDSVIIDIASKPGGTDFEACKHFGIAAKLCLSLPGKYSPKSSSGIIYKCLDLRL